MYSLIIQKATIIDGAGKPGFVGDVAVDGDKIVAVAPHISQTAKNIINAQGLVLTPGFIDIQNHSDTYWQLFENPGLGSLITQGFTTIVVGNCGASLAPLLSPQGLLSAQKWHALSASNINWVSFKEYATHLSQSQFACNVASLVGYSTLRRGLIGDEIRALDEKETEILQRELADSLSAGAFGLSTGLSYAHEADITEQELYQMAKITAEHRGLLSVHLRNESEQVVEALEEAINLSSRSGVRLKISHFKIRGKKNWHYFDACVDRLETAYHRGLPVNFDVYPYTSIWQTLYTYLPRWAFTGGRKTMLKHFNDPVARKKLLSYLHNLDFPISELVIAETTALLNIAGKKVGAIAKNMGITSEEALLEILEKGGEEVMVFDSALNEEQVNTLCDHPLGIISTDGAGFPEVPFAKKGLVHPRCFGTTQKFLKSVISDKQITLEHAIYKLTSQPSQALGLEKRGTITVGNVADLCLLDPMLISDKATLKDPYSYGTGIKYVFVGGVPVVENFLITLNRPGKFLRK